MRLILRLLADDGGLLGWAEARGLRPGDGTVRLAGARAAVVVASGGTAAAFNVHWPELNVNATIRLQEPRACRPGDVFEIQADGPVMSFASSEETLEPVTVGAVEIAVQAGSLGAG